MQNRRLLSVALSVLAFTLAGSPVLAQKTGIARFGRTIPLDPAGSFALENASGNVTIVGSDSANGLTIEGEIVVQGVDEEAVKEGLVSTKPTFGGDRNNLMIVTRGTPVLRTARWSSSVNYHIRVPSSVNVRVVAAQSPHLRLQGINGNLTVNNVSGHVQLVGVQGPTSVDSINGSITAHYPTRPTTNVRLSSINGSVDVFVPPTSTLEWFAETLKGELLTSFALRGGFVPNVEGRVFRGSLNNGQVPQFRVTSITNRVYLLPIGATRQLARALRPAQSQLASETSPRAPQEDIRAMYQRVSRSLLVQPPSAKSFTLQRNAATGDVEFSTQMGNVFVGEIGGDAKISTRAGEIVLGRVRGRCDISTLGGPLNLGDIWGELIAKTSGGDILIRNARSGGTAVTDGGSIQVISAGAPIRLISGGGDITVRNAASDVRADTRNGDINLWMPRVPGARHVGARSIGGNITIHASRMIRADVDLTVLTDPGTSHRIESDFPGLAVTREQSGNRVRIRATGKINGGGDRIELRSEDGMIQLRADLP
jgi:DUF4097 and DUF4098 domain-containing protein YvlB